jgi:hypothetical protein
MRRPNHRAPFSPRNLPSNPHPASLTEAMAPKNLARVRPASKSKSNKSAWIGIEQNGGEECGTYTQVVLVDVEAAELLVVPFVADGEGAGCQLPKRALPRLRVGRQGESGSWIMDWQAPTTPRSLTTSCWHAHHRGHHSAGHEHQGSGWRGDGGSPR